MESQRSVGLMSPETAEIKSLSLPELESRNVAANLDKPANLSGAKILSSSYSHDRNCDGASDEGFKSSSRKTAPPTLTTPISGTTTPDAIMPGSYSSSIPIMKVADMNAIASGSTTVGLGGSRAITSKAAPSNTTVLNSDIARITQAPKGDFIDDSLIKTPTVDRSQYAKLRDHPRPVPGSDGPTLDGRRQPVLGDIMLKQPLPGSFSPKLSCKAYDKLKARENFDDPRWGTAPLRFPPPTLEPIPMSTFKPPERWEMVGPKDQMQCHDDPGLLPRFAKIITDEPINISVLTSGFPQGPPIARGMSEMFLEDNQLSHDNCAQTQLKDPVESTECLEEQLKEEIPITRENQRQERSGTIANILPSIESLDQYLPAVEKVTERQDHQRSPSTQPMSQSFSSKTTTSSVDRGQYESTGTLLSQVFTLTEAQSSSASTSRRLRLLVPSRITAEEAKIVQEHGHGLSVRQYQPPIVQPPMNPSILAAVNGPCQSPSVSQSVRRDLVSVKSLLPYPEVDMNGEKFDASRRSIRQKARETHGPSIPHGMRKATLPPSAYQCGTAAQENGWKLRKKARSHEYPARKASYRQEHPNSSKIQDEVQASRPTYQSRILGQTGAEGYRSIELAPTQEEKPVSPFHLASPLIPFLPRPCSVVRQTRMHQDEEENEDADMNDAGPSKLGVAVSMRSMHINIRSPSLAQSRDVAAALTLQGIALSGGPADVEGHSPEHAVKNDLEYDTDDTETDPEGGYLE